MNLSNLWPSTALRTDDGAIALGGCDVRSLANEFGTPLFVVDEADFRRRARGVRSAFEEAFAPYSAKVNVFYAGKAFLSSQVAKWVMEEGLNLDIAYEGELRLALQGHADGSRLAMHGNNKTRRDIELALDASVGHLIVDSMDDAQLIAETASAKNRIARVLVRVVTGVKAGGHDGIATAHEDQKFGVSIAAGEAMSVLEYCERDGALDLRGIHTHVGSQIFDISEFEESARRMFNLRAAFHSVFGRWLPEMNLGGGFGVPYLDSDRAVDIHRAAKLIANTVGSIMRATSQPWPALAFEPGRIIAAPTTVTLYTVGATKSVIATTDDGRSLERRYVSVDGGMSDNMRVVAYSAKYTAQLASRSSSAPEVLSRVVGRHCESGDIVVDEVQLPMDVVRGDLLAVPVTGAYGHAMSNLYNSVKRPGVVAVRDGEARWIVHPITVKDILQFDVAPQSDGDAGVVSMSSRRQKGA